MDRPPRRFDEPLLSGRLALIAVAQGASVLVAVLGLYVLGQRLGESADASRAWAFAALIASNVALIFVNRAWGRSALATLRTRNLAASLVTVFALGFLALTLFVAPLRGLFHFGEVSPLRALIAIAAGAGSVLWFEIVKGRLAPDARGRTPVAPV